METPWQTYTKLQESLNKVNLINASLQFVLTNGNRVEGLLGDFVFDRDNLFLELKDACINDDKLKDFTLMGVQIYRWRILCLAPSITNHASTFARATFCANGTDAKPVSNARFVFIIIQTLD